MRSLRPFLISSFGSVLFLLAALCLSQPSSRLQGVAYTSFLAGEYPVTASWVPQSWPDSQAISAVRVSREHPCRGLGALEADFELIAGHPNLSQGETYVDLRFKPPLFEPPSCPDAPFDLTGQEVGVEVYVTSEMYHPEPQRNGLQIFLKSQDAAGRWWSFYGAWHNIEATDVGTCKRITATPSTMAPEGGFVDEDFDPRRIVSVGVKLGTGDGSDFQGSGSFFIDNFDWSGGIDPEYGFENVDDSIKVLTQHHIDSASVLVTWFMDGATASEIRPVEGLTHTDTEVIALIDSLQQRNVEVLLKPHVDVLDGTWRGLIQPQNVDLWFAEYRAFITHYARIARDHDVGIFAIGTELESLSGSEHLGSWLEVIGEVRAIYDGSLTYAANWDAFSQARSLELAGKLDPGGGFDLERVGRGFQEVSFWEFLDYVGINAYFPLSDEDAPSLPELIAGWTDYRGVFGRHDWLAEIEELHDAVGKPALFTEIGYPSCSGSTAEPWSSCEPAAGDVLDEELQARAYEAAHRALESRPWLAGLFWWNWYPWSDAGGRCDLGYTPQNKLAEEVLRAGPTPACSPTGNVLCLSGGRFRVEVRWREFEGGEGPGFARPLTADTGAFWFFDPENLEVLVKVLDACVEPFHHFWVFAAGLTNLETELIVTDTATGVSRTYRNPLGTAFQPVLDTTAFDTCGRGAAGHGSGQLRGEARRQSAALRGRALASDRQEKSCAPGATSLCLNGGRFRVEALWQTPDGGSGAGQALPLTGESGYFWFFGADNVEVIVKLLDACGLPQFRNYWVFAAGLTNVEVLLRVTDTESGEVREYRNPQGTAFQPIQDTGSFATCPGPLRLVIDAPAGGEVGLTVTFRWHLENPVPGEAYRYEVRLDKGVNACDGSIEEAFDAGGETCLRQHLDPGRYTDASVEFAVRVSDTAGEVLCKRGMRFRVDPELPASPPCP